ncbi:hypothetical protein [Promicromonospora sp. NPDC060271]|uniref:hypothetical protein n=1 Tax=Promicromonospora sp. NPDC060271 TaxID=3347089 RepID=UPI003647D294
MTERREKTPDSDEIEPRAWLHDNATGTGRPVLRSEIQGLDEWVENWPVNTDLPSAMTFSAWQGPDENHAIGDGDPGYRIVYKTIRTATVPMLNVNGGNLRISIQNGPVNWGEPRFTNALPGRREGDWLVPQWGTLHLTGERRGYEALVDRSVEVEAHTETTPSANYVEVLYNLGAENGSHTFSEKMALGRAATAPLTAALDLVYGERLLGAVLTEEVGEVFPDWHWNRLLGGRNVAMEAQARFESLDAHAVASTLDSANKLQAVRDDEQRARLRIAAQWYWRADRDADTPLRFLSYWLCIEALELAGNEYRITPIKAAVAAVLGVQDSDVALGVVRISNLRNKIAHGKVRDVSAGDIERVRSVAEALLEARLLGTISDARRASLRAAVLDPSV